MPEARRAIVIDPRDNVATALEPLSPGDRVDAPGQPVAVLAPIPRGHKVALRPIARGEVVVKYGEAIGKASRDIAAGEHAHTQNIDSLFADWLSARSGNGGS